MAEPVFYTPPILGFASYKPRKAALRILDQVGEVLLTYRASLPLTLRQVYYRLVATHAEHVKGDAFYQRLSAILARGRRAGLIDWQAVRDDGVTERLCGGGYADIDGFRDAIRRDAEWYSRSKHANQPRQIIVLCEASGMLPQLVAAIGDFPAIVRSSGGMDSVTAKYELAMRCARKESVILHVGDWDPSGLSIFHGIFHDVRRLMEDYCFELAIPEPSFECKRITVLPKHVEAFDLLTGRTKAGDTAKTWYPGIGGDPLATCEAEALPPDVLAEMVRSAVGAEMDLWAYNAAVAAEARERQLAIDAVERLDFGEGGDE